MKDCEPRDRPHLPDSRANERPHWIIPHNASATKAQQLTQERDRARASERGRGGSAKGDGAGQTVMAHCWSVGRMVACTAHTHFQNKGFWDGNNSLCSVTPLPLLRRFSAPPSLAVCPPPPSHSHSLSQEDLKYQCPFLLDIAFSL